VPEPTTFDPRTVTVFTVPLPAKYKCVPTVFVEPKPNFYDKNNLCVAPSICSTSDGHLRLQVLNSINQSVQLYPGTHMGTIASYAESQNYPVSVVYSSEPPFEETTAQLKELITNTIDPSLKHLTCQEREQLVSLLTKFPSLYAVHETDCGRTNLVSHQIHTGNNLPIKRHPFRTSPKEKDVIRKELGVLEKQNIISKSTSDQANAYWSIPIDDDDREKLHSLVLSVSTTSTTYHSGYAMPQLLFNG